MTESMTLVPCAAGFELRRGDGVVGRLGDADAVPSHAEAGDERWEIELQRDLTRLDGTWQVSMSDAAGEQVALYFHGGIRGGRVRPATGEPAALRRGLGLGADWRLRLKDCALVLRPTKGPGGVGLRLDFMAGSVEPPLLVLLLACWCVMSEARMDPPSVDG